MILQGITLAVSVLLVGSNMNTSVFTETNSYELFTEIKSMLSKKGEKINNLHQDKLTLSRANVLSENQAKKVISKTSREAITAIKNKDMKRFKTLVHPDKGVRFSPYTYVDFKEDIVFSANQLEKLPRLKKVYNWGAWDGSGDPIKLTFNEYYRTFIYDRDYANAEKVSYNKVLMKGNTINNIREVYPNSIIVEYYFSGSSQYEGMDWSSLRLVYEKKDSQWYLVGVVHDQWTI
ncbi:hypothetical protein [Priestia megaterium]|uniref:hypothetical protein n=1 Tax=Priestia megaterium TaxID=1404 RepID=UPI0035B5A171